MGCKMATVLVVDDEQPIAEFVGEVLEEDGHVVIVVYNAHAALVAAQEHHPDLVLTDVMMPAMSGVELARHLRADPSHRSLVVILMSAAPSPDLERAGAVAFLGKPFTLDAVSALVAAHAPPARAGE